jgi:hypothetical protein
MQIRKKGDEIKKKSSSETTGLISIQDGTDGHNFERDPPRDHPCQVWCNLVQQFQMRRFKCDLLSKYA